MTKTEEYFDYSESQVLPTPPLPIIGAERYHEGSWQRFTKDGWVDLTVDKEG